MRAARRALTASRDASPLHSELGTAPVASYDVQPYAWADLLYFHRGPEYPLCVPETVPDGAGSGATSKRLTTLPLLGRRKTLHDFRSRQQTHHHITAVQGPAGIGKTAFCYEILQLYKRLEYAVLILRCGEVEVDPHPLTTLLWQCIEAASQLAKTQWPTLCAIIDESVVDQLDMPPSTARMLMLLQVLLQHSGQPRLVLYLDNLDSLMSRRGKEDTARHWRQPEMSELWHALVHMAQESQGQLAVLASSRYSHADLKPYLLYLPPLTPDAAWSLLSRLPALQHLAPDNRHRLLKRIDGQPQWHFIECPRVSYSRQCHPLPVQSANPIHNSRRMAAGDRADFANPKSTVVRTSTLSNHMASTTR